jgi:hypothetical protein
MSGAGSSPAAYRARTRSSAIRSGAPPATLDIRPALRLH